MAKVKLKKSKKASAEAPKAKKKPSKEAKREAKKPADAKKSAKKLVKKAKVLVNLSSEQRRRTLKPREGYPDLIERITRTWTSHKALRVPGLTTARLLKLLRDAERAADREAAAREKLETALRGLTDRRLLAEESMWRAVLDVNAAVKLFARSDPSLADTFGFLTDALSSTPGPKPAAEPEPPPAGDGT